MQEKVLLKDEIATILFTDEGLIEYVEAIISKVLAIPFNEVHGNLSLISPRVNAKATTKSSTVDAAYESKDNYLNIEINYNDSKYTQDKNMRYICNLLLKQDVGKNKSQKYFKGIIQLNINNYDYFKLNQFIYKSCIMEETYHRKRSDLIYIYDINVDFLSKFNYNEIKEKFEDSLEELLYIFVCNDEDNLKKLYHGNKIMEKVVNKASGLQENWYEDLYYDSEELRRLSLEEVKEKAKAEGMDKGMKKGMEQGLAKGLAEGILQSKIETVKNLYKMNMSKENINQVVNLSIEEITEILKENQDN